VTTRVDDPERLRRENDARVTLRRWDRFHLGRLTRLYHRWETYARPVMVEAPLSRKVLIYRNPVGNPTVGDLLTLATANELQSIGRTLEEYETVHWLFPDAGD
jgi:hypothetical protein